MQQQRDAFYAHHFDTLPQKELEQFVARFRPKKPAQFPPPEYIYTKQFAFLSAPMAVIHSKQGIGTKRTAADPSHKDKPTTSTKNSPACKESTTEPSREAASEPRSRFGVRLEDKNQDSDGSIIIPEELEEMLAASLKADPRVPDDELITRLDNISLSKRETNEFKVNCRWVEDLVQPDAGGAKTCANTELRSLAKGPLLISESDIIRVSTPLRERYNRVQ